MILHTVNKTAALTTCLETAAAGDLIVLLEDGVYGVLNPAINKTGLQWLAMEADLKARGLLEKTPTSVTVAGYDEMVAACVTADAITSWF